MQERDRFLERGFLRVEQIASAEDRAILGRIYDRCFGDDPPPGLKRKALGGVRDGRQLLPQVMQPSACFPEIAELDYVRRAHDLARTIFGEGVERRSEHMIFKPAHYGAVTPWHQDQAYHDPRYDYRNVNFWLPLDGADAESGCLQFVPGSHRGLIVPHRRAGGDADASAAEAIEQEYWSANAVTVPCEPGDVTLHHSYCLHYADANHSARPRRAYILVFGLPPVRRERPWNMPWLADLRQAP